MVGVSPVPYTKLAIGFGTMVIKPQDDETFHSGTATATTSITSLKYYGRGFAQFDWFFSKAFPSFFGHI